MTFAWGRDLFSSETTRDELHDKGVYRALCHQAIHIVVISTSRATSMKHMLDTAAIQASRLLCLPALFVPRELSDTPRKHVKWSSYV